MAEQIERVIEVDEEGIWYHGFLIEMEADNPPDSAPIINFQVVDKRDTGKNPVDFDSCSCLKEAMNMVVKVLDQEVLSKITFASPDGTEYMIANPMQPDILVQFISGAAYLLPHKSKHDAWHLAVREKWVADQLRQGLTLDAIKLAYFSTLQLNDMQSIIQSVCNGHTWAIELNLVNKV